MLGELLDNREKRQIQMLTILYESNSWMTTAVLADRLHCSERTLIKDISDLKAIFQDKHALLTSFKGIKLDSHDNLKSFYQVMLKNSVSFQILEHLLFHESETIGGLADTLYISKSTLVRTIKRINDILNPYRISISTTNTCKIIGNEKQIRHFFILYFSECYNYYEWPFKKIHESRFECLLVILMKSVQLEPTFTSMRQLKFLLAISITRTNHGHMINLPILKLSTPSLSIDVLNELLGLINHQLDVAISDDYLNQILWVFLNPHFVTSYDSLLNLVQRDNQSAHIFELLNNLLTAISRQIDIPIHQKEKIMISLFNMSFLYNHTDKDTVCISSNMFNDKQKFVNGIEERYPCLMHTIKKEFAYYHEKSGLDFAESTVNEFIYKLLISWQGLFLEWQKRREKVTITVISHYDIEHAQMIGDLMKVYFNHSVALSVYDQLLITQDNIDELDCDIILSTTVLKEIDHPKLITIQNVPTEKEILSIYKEIDSIKRKRRAAD